MSLYIGGVVGAVGVGVVVAAVVVVVVIVVAVVALVRFEFVGTIPTATELFMAASSNIELSITNNVD